MRCNRRGRGTGQQWNPSETSVKTRNYRLHARAHAHARTLLPYFPSSRFFFPNDWDMSIHPSIHRKRKNPRTIGVSNWTICHDRRRYSEDRACSPVPKKGIERTWDTERERKREKKGGWQWLISQLHGLRHALWEDQSSSSILLLAVNEERWKEEERKKGEGKVRKKKNRKKRGWEKKSDDTRGGPSRLITIHVL